MGSYTFYPEEMGGKGITLEAPDAKQALDALNRLRAESGAIEAPVTAKGLGEQALASYPTGAAYALGLPATVGDYLGWLMRRGLQGAYKGITGDTPESAEAAAAAGHEAPGAYEQFLARPDAPPSPASGGELAKRLNELTGGATARQPQNVAEEYVRTQGEFQPTGLMLGGPMGLLLSAGAGLTSETAGQLARNLLPEDMPEAMKPFVPDWIEKRLPEAETAARVAGAVMDPRMLLQMARKGITPHPARSRARLDAAKRFEQEGIPFTAAQKTGSRALDYSETQLGGRKYAELLDDQKKAFTRAVLKRIGINADEASPDVFREAHRNVGNMYKRLTSQYSIPKGTNKLVADLDDAVSFYGGKVKTPNQAPFVKDIAKEIKQTLKKGDITGSHYQSLISRLRRYGKGADADLSIYTRAVRDALDDAMEAQIARVNPNDLGSWNVARNQWRDLIAIEDAAVTGAGGMEGFLNPTKLHETTTRGVGKRAAAQQTNDLNSLAASGKVLMQKLTGDSGTATRLIKELAPFGAGSMTGAAIGSAIPVVGPFMGAAAGAAGTAGMRALRMSKIGQKYLGNQLLKPSKGLTQKEKAANVLRMIEQGRSSSQSRHRGGGRNAD
jgi:uncharacterized protein (DUF697 family)